jgi:hypothetical protein
MRRDHDPPGRAPIRGAGRAGLRDTPHHLVHLARQMREADLVGQSTSPAGIHGTILQHPEDDMKMTAPFLITITLINAAFAMVSISQSQPALASTDVAQVLRGRKL